MKERERIEIVKNKTNEHFFMSAIVLCCSGENNTSVLFVAVDAVFFSWIFELKKIILRLFFYNESEEYTKKRGEEFLI